jgi:NAD(P)H-nitrite reductase large subunit
MNYLIIGNSAAGIGAAEAIRRIDKVNPITILSEEPYEAYSRPLIAEYFSETIDLTKMWYRTSEYYKQYSIDLKINTCVKRVDAESQTVFLQDDTYIQYDKLLIATGGTPIIPPMEGLEAEGIFTFVRWDEVKKIKAYQQNIKNAVVIGAGLIGLKAAEHMTKAGIDVTIVELADTMLGMVLDKTASNLLQTQFEEHGVTVCTGNTVQKIHQQDGKVSGVTLQNGTNIDCDAVVIAIGVKPNIAVTENTGIETNKGIIVNEKMQTNYPNVYAAGDVAEGFDLLVGEKRVLPIWPVAYRQGFVAGTNMTGVEKNYEGGISMNSLEFFGLPIISAGYSSGTDDTCSEDCVLNEKKKLYKKIICKDNKLVGFIYLNKIDRAGILTGLIKEKVDICSFKEAILKDTFGLIDLPREIQNEKLQSVNSSKT